MTASGYPWADEHLRTAAVLTWDTEGYAAGPGSVDVRGRTAVAAVGSNASPAVLVRKLSPAGPGVVVLEPGRLPGVLVGHSAHVSPGGYIPAAPYAAPGTTDVLVGWFDPAQVALLDATEPNYERRHLVDAGLDVYVSRWGVIAVAGVPVPLCAQDELLARLRPPALAAGGHLGDPAVAAHVSRWLQAEHAVDAGLSARAG